jgi:hypothetical protein
MYRNTRRSRKVWTYKNTDVGSATYASAAPCRAMVERCPQTFIRLKLLQARDFEELSTLGQCLGNNGVAGVPREGHLIEDGVRARRHIHGAQLSARAAQVWRPARPHARCRNLSPPQELRDFQCHLKAVSASLATRMQQSAAKVLFQVPRNGKGTAYTPHHPSACSTRFAPFMRCPAQAASSQRE